MRRSSTLVSRWTARTLLAALMLPTLMAAQSVAQPVAASASGQLTTTKSRTIGLLAAVGDEFQYVRLKQSVGSNLDPYTRSTISVPDQGLNKMVLRGLDRAVAAQYPDAEIVMMTLAPDSPMTEILPHERETHTMSRVKALLQTYPGRERWDEVMVVTPKWLRTDREGMGTKLSGIGLYVQPLGANREVVVGADGVMDDEIRDIGQNKRDRSNTYVAPFFYIQMTVLDAKTLEVLRTEARYDFRKLINSDSTALDVAKSITPERLSIEIEKFVESAARRLVVDKEGSVDIGPVKKMPAPVQK